MYEVSSSALRPLMKTFFGSQGWRPQPNWPPPDVFARSVSAGVMFAEQVILDHDGWVEAAREVVADIKADDVADAFITSLTTERLDLRSALGSFAVARWLPEHELTPRQYSDDCAICGLPPRSQEDLNRMNFERFKWGGLRRDEISYVAFDLEQFSRAPRDGMNAKALDAGRKMIDALRTAPPDATASQVASRLKMVKGKQPEREVLLDILGVCGILSTPEHSGYGPGFVQAIDRKMPPQRHVERAYPVCWWRGRDRIDEEALREFLPELAS